MISVRGRATAEEIAAVLAALGDRAPVAQSAYERWRAARIAALAATRDSAAPPSHR